VKPGAVGQAVPGLGEGEVVFALFGFAVVGPDEFRVKSGRVASNSHAMRVGVIALPQRLASRQAPHPDLAGFTLAGLPFGRA